MFSKSNKNLILVLSVLIITSEYVETRRILLRPLSSKEVYKVLKAAGREDAIPEGRVVTQGLAAIAGFGLGLASGIGGSLLIDLAATNATTEWLNSIDYSQLVGNQSFSMGTIDYASLLPNTSFGTMDYSSMFGNNTFNFTSLFGSKGGSSSSSSSATSSTGFAAQEICFLSRSMDYNEREARQNSPTTTTGTGTGTGSTGVISSPTTTSTGTTPSTIATGTTGTTPTATGAGDTTCILVEKRRPRSLKRRAAKRKLRNRYLKYSVKA